MLNFLTKMCVYTRAHTVTFIMALKIVTRCITWTGRLFPTPLHAGAEVWE